MNKTIGKNKGLCRFLALALVFSLVSGIFAGNVEFKSQAASDAIELGDEIWSVDKSSFSFSNATVSFAEKQKVLCISLENYDNVESNEGYFTIGSKKRLTALTDSGVKVSGVAVDAGYVDSETVTASTKFTSFTAKGEMDNDVILNLVKGIKFFRNGMLDASKQNVSIATSSADVPDDMAVMAIDGELHFYKYFDWNTDHNDTTGKLGWYDAYEEAKSSTYKGLTGYLATVTSENEQQYIFKSLANIDYSKFGAWIGGARTMAEDVNGNEIAFDSDSVRGKVNPGTIAQGENTYYITNKSNIARTFRWMCGPEAGDVFYVTDKFGRVNTDSNVDAYSYWNQETSSEPNNSNNSAGSSDEVQECFVEYGYNTTGAWNDWRSNNNYNNAATNFQGAVGGYIVEYSSYVNAKAGVTAANNTFNAASAKAGKLVSVKDRYSVKSAVLSESEFKVNKAVEVTEVTTDATDDVKVDLDKDFSYQWEVYDAVNALWTDIESANGVEFTPNNELSGKKVRVKITGNAASETDNAGYAYGTLYADGTTASTSSDEVEGTVVEGTISIKADDVTIDLADAASQTADSIIKAANTDVEVLEDGVYVYKSFIIAESDMAKITGATGAKDVDVTIMLAGGVGPVKTITVHITNKNATATPATTPATTPVATANTETAGTETSAATESPVESEEPVASPEVSIKPVVTDAPATVAPTATPNPFPGKRIITINPTNKNSIYAICDIDGNPIYPQEVIASHDKKFSETSIMKPNADQEKYPGYYDPEDGIKFYFLVDENKSYVISEINVVSDEKTNTSEGMKINEEDVDIVYNDKGTEDKDDDRVSIIVKDPLTNTLYGVVKVEENGDCSDVTFVRTGSGNYVASPYGAITWADTNLRSDGTIAFKGLEPGTYKVVAIANIENGNKVNPSDVEVTGETLDVTEPKTEPISTPEASVKPVVSASPAPSDKAKTETSSVASAIPSVSATPAVSAAPTLAPEIKSVVDDFINTYLTDVNGKLIVNITDETRDIVASGKSIWNTLTDEQKAIINSRLAAVGLGNYDSLYKKASSYKIPGFKITKYMKKGSTAKVKMIKTSGAKIITTSTNKSVAIISDKGVIKAKKVGKATLTILAVKGKSTNRVVINLKVKKKFKNAKELTKFKSKVIKTPTILIAKKRKVKKSSKISVYDLAKKSKVKYKAIKKKIIKINSKGKFKGKKKGSSLIKVTVHQNNKDYLLYVYVSIYKKKK